MLNIAIYGMGTWGRRLVDSVQGSTKVKFGTIITRDPARHREYADKAGIKLSTSYDEVLKDPGVDAVLLATPHSQHSAQIIQAAKAGKHVYTEKPMSLTRASAQAAVDACRTAGVTFTVGFNRRHAPAFVEMKKRIHAGEIGDVLHIEGQLSGPTAHRLKADSWRATRAEAPAGGMTARGIHALDAMIQIGGLVNSVYAFSNGRKMPANIDMDGTTTMLLGFASGVTGCLTSVFLTGELWRVHVFGTKGWLEMRADSDLTFCGLEGAPQAIPLPKIDKERTLLEAFADAVAAKQSFMVPADEAVNGIAVLESIEKSAKSGQPVKIA